MTPESSHAPAPIPDAEVEHRRMLFDNALTGSEANVHRLGNTIRWLGELGPRAAAVAPALERILANELPPSGAWSVRADAARALAQIDPAKYRTPSERVLIDLATSSDFEKHVAGTLVLGWMGELSEESFTQLETAAQAEGAPVHLHSWFAEKGFRLRRSPA